MAASVSVVIGGGRRLLLLLPLLLLLLVVVVVVVVAAVGVEGVGVTMTGAFDTAGTGGTTTEGGGGEIGLAGAAAAAAAATAAFALAAPVAAVAAALKGGGKVSPSLRTGAWHPTQNNRWPSEGGEATKGVLQPGTGQMLLVSFQPSCSREAMSFMMRCLLAWQGVGEEGVGCWGLGKEPAGTRGEDDIGVGGGVAATRAVVVIVVMLLLS